MNLAVICTLAALLINATSANGINRFMDILCGNRDVAIYALNCLGVLLPEEEMRMFNKIIECSEEKSAMELYDHFCQQYMQDGSWDKDISNCAAPLYFHKFKAEAVRAINACFRVFEE